MRKIRKLDELVEFKSGSPQFRIKETDDVNAPVYNFYSQSDLLDDISGLVKDSSDGPEKITRTYDDLHILKKGDLIYSLISAKASIVGQQNSGKVCTQNYIVLEPLEILDKAYLMYILNEDIGIKRQLLIGLQGSTVLKYSLKQIKELEIVSLPDIEKQRLIGDIYLKQKKISALRLRVAERKELTTLEKLSMIRRGVSGDK